MFFGNEDWITYQMTAAKAMGIPIVAIELFGGIGEIPDEITRRAAGIAGWNERLIVDAVRQHGRGEDTTRFETIEFEMP